MSRRGKTQAKCPIVEGGEQMCHFRKLYSSSDPPLALPLSRHLTIDFRLRAQGGVVRQGLRGVVVSAIDIMVLLAMLECDEAREDEGLIHQ